MAILKILQYPDPRLHTVAAPVVRFDQELHRLIRDMAETMYAAPGVGLAATQVDVHRQVIVVDVSETHDQLQVLINPEILEGIGESPLEEGCLSVPGIYDQVPRYERIRGKALDATGQPREVEADGLLAVCIQHEMDHLQGTLFIDHLSRLKRSYAISKVKKAKKRDAA